jgi:hypothetical protein
LSGWKGWPESAPELKGELLSVEGSRREPVKMLWFCVFNAMLGKEVLQLCVVADLECSGLVTA